MNIRPEQSADIAAIRDLVFRAFEHHPHHAPGARPTEHLIIDRLRDEGALSLSFVVDDGDKIVGHIAFSKIRIKDEDRGWYGLGPVAVLPGEQGRGVGSALIREGLAELEANGAAGVVLLGEPAYYARFGFRVDERLSLPGVPAGYFQILPFGDAVPTGQVAYHTAFG